MAEIRARWVAAKLGAIARVVPPDLIGAIARCGQGTRALALAQLVTEPSDRLRAFLAAGAELAKADLPEAADEGLAAAFAILSTQPGRGGDALAVLVEAYGALEQLDAVERVAALAEHLPGDRARAPVIAAAVRACAENGAAAQCLRWTARLPAGDEDATTTACAALVQAGHSGEAVGLARGIDTSCGRARVLAVIADRMVARGEIDAGVALAREALDGDGSAVQIAIQALGSAGRRDLA